MRPLKALISKRTINRAHVSDNPKEITNFSYEDLLNSGNIVRIVSEKYEFDTIVVNAKDANSAFKKIIDIDIDSFKSEVDLVSIRKLKSGGNYIFTYSSDFYFKNFPNSNTKITKIQKVYSSKINVSDIYTVEDFIKIFEKYNLEPVPTE